MQSMFVMHQMQETHNDKKLSKEDKEDKMKELEEQAFFSTHATCVACACVRACVRA